MTVLKLNLLVLVMVLGTRGYAQYPKEVVAPDTIDLATIKLKGDSIMDFLKASHDSEVLRTQRLFFYQLLNTLPVYPDTSCLRQLISEWLNDTLLKPKIEKIFYRDIFGEMGDYVVTWGLGIYFNEFDFYFGGVDQPYRNGDYFYIREYGPPKW